MLSFIGVSEDMLPTLLDSGQYVGTYEGIKVVTSAMDQIAAAIGAGVAKPGRASVMTGTTMAIFVPTENIPAYDPTSIVPCHYSYDGCYCLLSWSATAGLALKWLRETFLRNHSFEEGTPRWFMAKDLLNIRRKLIELENESQNE